MAKKKSTTKKAKTTAKVIKAPKKKSILRKLMFWRK